jgi:hypothetical protein
MKSLTSVVVLLAVVASGCNAQSPIVPDRFGAAEGTSLSSATRTTSIVQLPLFIQDAGGRLPTGASTPLFEVRAHNPILAPDGHQVTLGEFNAVDGIASVQCLGRGTSVTLRLSHLIPDGVYTIWNVVFRDPGFDPTFGNMIGLGALGSASGTQNAFRASATGDASISAITQAGPLSALGSIGACAPVDEFEWHIVGAYHIDGESHGPVLGPEGTAVEQFGFVFKR